MRILLTGSSGWLARFLAPLLVESGHSVIGLDVVPGAHTRIVGTVADRALIDRTMGEHGIEAVIHGGALHKPDIVRYPRQAFVDVNISGTLNLIEAAVAAGNDRFLFTSTTSLMVRADVRDGAGETGAWWMDEDFGPLAPRNIYGITKLAAEQACRLVHRERGINVAILRTGRFFPEDDDTHAVPSGPNLKANELLHRRLTVEDAAAAHLAALEAAPRIGCDTFVLSAPPPFARDDAAELARDARAVIARYHPDAANLYAAAGWVLPETIDRVYDPSRAERRFGWRAQTDFGAVLAALREGSALPFAHDPAYTSPIVRQEREACTS
ncbi:MULTISPECIES: NAD(P)-dependent oxidoreductase [unclassified Sphingopyxis]|uniref:NAD-dependent epimerase/dehydratase family protein n=1 Tax=unclassified Sphingopyxis TaxID=2614943 RepID=UPI0028653A9C|nr:MULTISPECIES: NAD(P)-dependent oxidoreductase [unclassified Sphingopyxis]MDR6832838.1 nucleoside-diphosphate-sugar epimerase [Sphingopyxis sp. BE122]MDR7228581.1 nucleoside-diphosphate-sugar epimerase [Sphingopyxis sp. BE259]